MKKDNPNFTHPSLIEAVDKTYIYITNAEGYLFAKPINPLDVVEYYDGIDWQPLQNLLI